MTQRAEDKMDHLVLTMTSDFPNGERQLCASTVELKMARLRACGVNREEQDELNDDEEGGGE